jgi:hypothetical protein
MTPDPIQHFLVIYDLVAGETTVRTFAADRYDAAIAEYGELEIRASPNLDIVLLSADSIETIKRTHSSYFDTEESFESLLPAGVLTAT